MVEERRDITSNPLSVTGPPRSYIHELANKARGILLRESYQDDARHTLDFVASLPGGYRDECVSKDLNAFV